MAKGRALDSEALKAWLAENPLRRWREKQLPEGRKQAVFARQIGTSQTAVHLWEIGERLPKIDAYAKVEALTKITCQEWMDWYNRKPKSDSDREEQA